MRYSTLLTSEQVRQVWHDAAPLIQTAISHDCTNSMSLVDIYHELLDGIMQLWIIYDEERLLAAMTTHLTQHGKHNTCVMVHYGAVIPNEEAFQFFPRVIEEWAEANDCKRVQIWGRAGWVKALYQFNYKKAFTVLDKCLGETDE